MIPKEIDALTKQDIDALIANSVSEGRNIEYKEELPGGSDEQKREFLADASSFANAGGGDLILGAEARRQKTF
jgi:predicted HTH transcriptional regulator